MKSPRHAFTLAALSVLTNVTLAQTQPATRDVWFEYVQDGVRYGSEHLTVVRTEQGTLRYTLESKMLIDLFGSQRQTITSTSVYLVSAKLRPISLQLDSSDLSGKASMRGKTSGEQFVVDVSREGATSEQRFALAGDDDLIFDVCLADRLATLVPSVSRVTLRVISDPSKPPSTVTVTRESNEGKAGSAWRLDSGEGIGVSRLRLDADGGLRSTRSEMPPLHIRRCTAKQASQLVHRIIDGREVLTFPLDKAVGAPGRLRALRVSLSWTGIPLKEFALEDGRQRIVARSNKGDRQTVVVAIAPPKPAVDERTLPIEDDAMQPFLAETVFVKPKNKEILTAARAAIAGEKNAAAAVRAIARFVNGHVEGKLVAGTLTGPEVLACRSGKCTEYATLFASLARSVGIPTRLALGERMVNGSWMGHMWNEAFVGRWITVDAGYQEVGESQLLLKFIHSDTVAGTQPLRWKLTKSLAISIESFELAPSELEARFKTGIVGATYTNTDHACRIAASGKGWSLADKTTPAAVTVQFKKAETKGLFVHFVAFAVPAGTPAKTLIDNRLRHWKRTYKDFDIRDYAACKVAGASGHTLRYVGATKGKTPRRNFSTEVMWVRGESGYLLNIISLEKAYKANLPEFEKLLKSFEFLKE